jgi:formate C-acetyltransferase
MNMALVLDMTLHNGVVHSTGIKLGPETGDPRNFKSFDDLWQAFKAQAEYYLPRKIYAGKIVDRVSSLNFRSPLQSAFSPGCIEKGRDRMAGGLKSYAWSCEEERAIVPAAESLMAVKHLVFDTKKLTMDELLDATDNNFNSGNKKREEIQQMCLAAPKYGNDLGEPEEMVRKVGKLVSGIVQAEKNIYGYPLQSIRSGQAWHWQAGQPLGALPYGRKAHEPLHDGSLAPMQGMDRNGLTALLNSALKADFSETVGGILTPTLMGSLFKSKENREKLAFVTNQFMKQGGTYLHLNVLDAETMRKAKKDPAQFRDLVVRVGGYSAYFVNLSPAVQDEIIRRSEHGV